MHLGSNRCPRKASNVRGQPVIGGGTFGGIGVEHRREIAEIPRLFFAISNPSRGAMKSIVSSQAFGNTLAEAFLARNRS
jgi:hypothetical protein